jgi:hypothetical protein
LDKPGAELVLAALAGEPVEPCDLELRLVVRVTTAPPGRRNPRPLVARGSRFV